MKNSIAVSMLLIAAFAFSSCSSTQPAANASYDDVYFSSTPKQQAPVVNTSQSQTQSKPSDYSSNQNSNSNPSRFDYTDKQPASSTTRTDQDGNTYVTNNYYYDPDDYYDYAYSSRLRRFYRPYAGWGYYDSYYTNSYWYDYNPASWGVSIYMGYNWWAPSFYYGNPFSWGFSISYGWPSYHCWGQPYWYWNYPYYYHSPYYAYWSGYNQGYWNGYWNGYYSGLYNNPYYYNSYDYNSYNNYYYGPRRNRTGSGSSSVPRASLASLYQKNVDNDRPRTPVISTVSSEPRPIAPAVVTPVKPGKNNASENAPAVIDNSVKPGKNPTVSDPRPAVNPALETAPVKPGKDNTTRPDDYTPAPSIKNPPVNPDPRPNYNQQMDNVTPSQPSVKPGKDDNYNNAPPRPKQEYQWENNPRPNQQYQYESNPRPNQQYQYESNPRPQQPMEYESAPKPKIEYQSEPRPSYQQPKNDRPKMESRPQQSNPRPSYTPSEPRNNPAPASQPQQRDNSSKENRRR